MNNHIIIYRGRFSPAIFSVLQSLYFGNTVLFITDELDYYKRLFINLPQTKGILKFYDLNNYNVIANEFITHYIHISDHPVSFQLGCFLRWFYLLEFCQKEKTDKFLYTDADVLFFSTVDKELNKIENYDFGVSTKLVTGTFLAKNLDFLTEYCNFLVDCYINRNEIFEKFKRELLPGHNVCDMLYFGYLLDRGEFNWLNLTKEIDRERFDHHLGEFYNYQNDGKCLKITYEDESAYIFRNSGEKVKAITLHCSAQNKERIFKFLLPKTFKLFKQSYKPIWDYSHIPENYQYGDIESYQKASEWLNGLNVEDWGCGAKFAAQFFSNYIGLDGYSQFADKKVDFETYLSDTDGLLLRHVLEHNIRWNRILKNAVSSYKKRMVLVTFLNFTSETTIQNFDGNGILNMTLNRNELLEILSNQLVWSEKLQNGEELFYLEKV